MIVVPEVTENLVRNWGECSAWGGPKGIEEDRGEGTSDRTKYTCKVDAAIEKKKGGWWERKAFG